MEGDQGRYERWARLVSWAVWMLMGCWAGESWNLKFRYFDDFIRWHVPPGCRPPEEA